MTDIEFHKANCSACRSGRDCATLRWLTGGPWPGIWGWWR